MTSRLAQWIWINFKIGSLTFSGSSRFLLFEEEIVEKRAWVSREEFHEAVTLAQVLPGPNVVNLGAYLGARLFGALGTTLGMLALALPGALLALPALWLFDLGNPSVRELVRGLTVGSTSLLVIFLARLFGGLESSDEEGEGAPRAKLSARLAVALTIALLSFLGTPISSLLAFAFPACLGVEFLL